MHKRRGFTLIELIISVAVIAALAAVTVSVFSGVIKKAEESAKAVAAREINEKLIEEEISGNEAEKISDVINIIESSGYETEGIVYDSESNRIVEEDWATDADYRRIAKNDKEAKEYGKNRQRVHIRKLRRGRRT